MTRRQHKGSPVSLNYLSSLHHQTSSPSPFITWSPFKAINKHWKHQRCQRCSNATAYLYSICKNITSLFISMQWHRGFESIPELIVPWTCLISCNDRVITKYCASGCKVKAKTMMLANHLCAIGELSHLTPLPTHLVAFLSHDFASHSLCCLRVTWPKGSQRTIIVFTRFYPIQKQIQSIFF